MLQFFSAAVQFDQFTVSSSHMLPEIHFSQTIFSSVIFHELHSQKGALKHVLFLSRAV